MINEIKRLERDIQCIMDLRAKKGSAGVALLACLLFPNEEKFREYLIPTPELVQNQKDLEKQLAAEKERVRLQSMNGNPKINAAPECKQYCADCKYSVIKGEEWECSNPN